MLAHSRRVPRIPRDTPGTARHPGEPEGGDAHPTRERRHWEPGGSDGEKPPKCPPVTSRAASSSGTTSQPGQGLTGMDEPPVGTAGSPGMAFGSGTDRVCSEHPLRCPTVSSVPGGLRTTPLAAPLCGTPRRGTGDSHRHPRLQRGERGLPILTAGPRDGTGQGSRGRRSAGSTESTGTPTRVPTTRRGQEEGDAAPVTPNHAPKRRER